MNDARSPRVVRIVWYIVGLWWLIAGTYGLVMHGNATGWWFVAGGIGLLATNAYMDGNGNGDRE